DAVKAEQLGLHRVLAYQPRKHPGHQRLTYCDRPTDTDRPPYRDHSVIFAAVAAAEMTCRERNLVSGTSPPPDTVGS
ncbi:hypothetical protein, partial [Mycobacterium avium]|uniref:hypothetical protein n=1 Tax=Mycobacterium avium TaxID=1764 RepID=UPI001F46A9D2